LNLKIPFKISNIEYKIESVSTVTLSSPSAHAKGKLLQNRVKYIFNILSLNEI